MDVRALGFSQRSEFIGERARSVGAQGAHTMWWRNQRGAHTTLWCGWLLAGPCLRVSKIGTSAFVSSNSENISFSKNLEWKNSRKQELAQWHLVNWLVPENA
jgi:hypothetical protein